MSDLEIRFRLLELAKEIATSCQPCSDATRIINLYKTLKRLIGIYN